MTFKKPINILYEVSLFAIFVVTLLYASWHNLLNKEIVDLSWDYGIPGLFVILVVIITSRSIIKNRGKHLISSFYFGFLIGIFLWSLFIINEIRSEKAAMQVTMLVGILLVGVIAAGIGATISFLVAFLLFRLIRKLPSFRKAGGG